MGTATGRGWTYRRATPLRPDDIERSVGLVLGLERVADIGTLMAILRSPLREAEES